MLRLGSAWNLKKSKREVLFNSQSGENSTIFRDETHAQTTDLIRSSAINTLPFKGNMPLRRLNPTCDCF